MSLLSLAVHKDSINLNHAWHLVALCCVNLAKLKLHFPKFLSPARFGLVLARRRNLHGSSEGKSEAAATLTLGGLAWSQVLSQLKHVITNLLAPLTGQSGQQRGPQLFQLPLDLLRLREILSPLRV